MKSQKLLHLSLMTLLLLTFNNCGKGFEALQLSDQSSTGCKNGHGNCHPTPTATPTPQPTSTPSPPTPTPTATPRPSATPTPTATPRLSPTPRPSATPNPTPITTPTATPVPTPVPSPAGATVATFQVTSSVGGSLPFTLGHAFRQGDVPAGTQLGSNFSDIQIISKNVWRDGSLKYAIISGRAGLQANVAKTIPLIKDGVRSIQPSLTSSDLRATGVSASLSYGSYGSVNWASTDWDHSFIDWISGPEMSSWIYRKPIGSDAHLVAWLEVRLYRGGAVEVVPWIENGYLKVANPGERSGVATFAINGTQKFSQSLTLLNHTRAMLGSGSTLSHWLGSDPRVTPRHDTAYMQASKLVPSYRANISASSSLWSGVVGSYTPLGQHDFPGAMGTTGFHESIGPLPNWDVMYLVSGGDPRGYLAILIHGYAAGRYGHHYRDESTNRAPRMSQYPNLVLNSGSGITDIGSATTNEYVPNTSGGTPPKLTNSHMPAIAYVAYVVSGRWYFMDEMQLLSTALFFKQGNQTRGFSEGRLVSSAGSNQTRGAAWAMRTLVHTSTMTPDDDTVMKNEFVGSVQYNINYYHSQYVAKPTNPLGFVQPYGDYTAGDGKMTAAWWMDDFFTFAMGYMKEMQPYSSAYDQKLNEFLNFKYKAIIGRLGLDQAGHHSYRRAAQYEAVYAPVENPNWSAGTGPWYANWGEAYTAQAYGSNPSGTALLGGYIDSVDFAFSYWGNLQPAISYAVDQNIPGALDAYNRMVGASNWSTNAGYFNQMPVWGVKPRTRP